MESFKPGIVVNGITVHPTGFEYILAFALHGCEWAIKEADSQEFKDNLRAYSEYCDAKWINNRLDKLSKEIKELKG